MNTLIKEYGELTTDELYEILKHRSEIYVVEQKCIYLDMDDKDKESKHIMIFDDGKLVGYIRVMAAGVSYPQASFGRLTVKKEYRGLKLGRKLVETAMDILLNKMGETEVKIQAQSYLEEFYKMFGFKPEGNHFMDCGIKHIYMTYGK